MRQNRVPVVPGVLVFDPLVDLRCCRAMADPRSCPGSSSMGTGVGGRCPKWLIVGGTPIL